MVMLERTPAPCLWTWSGGHKHTLNLERRQLALGRNHT